MRPSPPGPVPAPPLPNSYWVEPGKLLAGEYPGGANRQETLARLMQLEAAGIDCFVDLTQPDERPSYAALLPPQSEYLREPIGDHDIPATRAQMVQIIDFLERALRSGRRPYVHCRAGIGRTGTVIGCLLAQRGLSGEDALTRLNQLWQQCARAKSWHWVPETSEQIAYVRAWSASETSQDIADPLEDQTVLSAARDLRERFIGALTGLAVGDALAAATQYRRMGTFAPVGDLLGGGPFDLPRGGWSDDTAMALCLAESLLESDGFDVRDQLQRYTRWQQDGHLSATGQCVGITASTARALSLAKWRRKLFAGSHDPAQLDPEPLSRLAPVIMFFFASPETAVRYACEAARTTCQAPAVLDACRLQAAVLYGALAGRPKREIFAPPAEILDMARLKPEIAALAGEGSKPNIVRAGEQATSALQAALWAFRTTDNFRAGALRAANLGGNSDVITTVYGQLAGAHYGLSAIPRTWRNSLIQKDLIEDFADRLLACALISLAD